MERLDRQIAASALWVELDQDVAGVDTLLDRVEQQVQDRGSGAVVAAPLNLIDMVMARISDPAIELVIAGDEPTRAAALALALTDCRPVRLSDAASDRSADRLRQLSDEVSRIASTLARLSTGPTAAPSRPAEVPASESPDVSADTIRSVIRARRLRARFFSEELFADPAWDMLLDLLQAEIAQLRVPVSSLCIAASVPATTALRWLKTMTEEGLFLRRADPHDGRRVFVELAPRASQAMRRYFAEVGRPAVV
jgi:DNA-binding MarR family transcriptional regulator